MAKSVMRHRFSNVPTANIPRSVFDRSHGVKMTFNAGYLTPFFVDEVLPGDTFTANLTAFVRLATPIKPIMDNLFLDVHWFFVPYRQVWTNFRKFMGEKDNPGDTQEYAIPLVSQEWIPTSLGDYMGLPTSDQTTGNIVVSALPFRAFNHIFNEWYRDQNLQNSLNVPLGDGPDDPDDYRMRRRGKRHDYFTSALPFPQKGQPVEISLGALAPLVSGAGVDAADPVFFGSLDNPGNRHPLQVNEAPGGVLWSSDSNPGEPNAFADLSSAEGVTINELREAFQIQKLLERDARGGTRYPEIVRSHFGVEFMDVTYRPLYLGGGTSRINVTPIAQTSSTDPAGPDASPQGNLAAMGTGTIGGNGFSQSFTEHGVVIGLVSARADLTYQQGVERFWSRSTRYDFYWPALSHLGEQAIEQREIFATGDDTEDSKVFGYQERFAEYRYKPSRIAGKFRSTDPESLDYWHLSQHFETAPVLDDIFIVEIPPIDRVIAVPTEPHFIFDGYISLRCARPMPVNAVPGLIDHF